MQGLNALILGLLILGHTALWVTFVNRTHALPWGHKLLRQLRHLHDVMIPLVPPLLIWRVGLAGPKLLRGGSWRDLSLFWDMVCAVCGAGFLWLVFVMLRGLLLRGPRALESSHSFLYDVRQELGRRPAGLGPYAVLTRVPLNEQFTIQMDEKTLRLPGLPAVWDGLTILHLSDWHFTGTVTREYFERAADLASALPADLACFTGDLIDNIALLDWLPKTLGRVQGTLGSFFILGNHDWYHDVPKIRRSLEELGWRDVGGRCETLAMHGQTLAIAGDETPWMGQHPAFPGDAAFRLLLSHTPDNIRWAQSRQVDLMLSGHTHGGQVRLPVIGPVYSPSKYGCKYASGTFWEPPTLMHVSRGLSGQHPLRWRCRPEITRVVLKSG